MKTLKAIDILLPNVQSNERWAVVSCDQFTSQRKYWSELANFVGDADSTLKMIFPEVYLEDAGANTRIIDINKTMNDYLDRGIFRTLTDSFVLVKRDTALGCSRLGLMVTVDLEDYCFTHPNNAYIRSTEGVVLDRIPPRLKIRTDAPIEIPHIMLLIDDRQKSVIEPLYEKRDSLEKLYDFDLNMKGGHLTGYRVDSAEVMKSFDKFEESVKGLYGVDTNFIFAVGDGNHSLATALAHWNNVKLQLNEEEKETHPARFALCEVENLHCDGLSFEPIHRFVFGADESEFVSFMCNHLNGEGKLQMFSKNMAYHIAVNENSAEAIAEIQLAIDSFIKENDGTSVDYIHGIEHLQTLADESEGIAIVMPKIVKEELFLYVIEHGTLCRKAFSMGEAEEKRYYFEAKRIK